MADDGGIERLKARLEAIPGEVRAAVQPALGKQAVQMAETMRTLAPVMTGRLKGSIVVTPGGQQTPAYSQPGGSMVVAANQVAITVGNTAVRYPHLVEYGTTRAHAIPFFWPAVRLHGKKARKAIKAAVGRAVRKNWGSGS